MKDKIRILLADDHLVVRMGLSALLSAQKGFTVVGAAADGREAVILAEKHRPDIVVMDLRMPQKDGVAATREILGKLPNTRILILTTFGDSRDVLTALNEGAAGALIKDCDKATLLSAIRTVAGGGRMVSPEIESAVSPAVPLRALSPRHREILQYASKGLSNIEIADLLGISRDCVKVHLSTAYERLGATSRTEAVTLALNAGLITG